jgi:DNA-binding MarR family transcriptional regulator
MKEQKISYVPIIQAWENFLKTNNNKNIESFGYWLVREQEKRNIASVADNELDEYFNNNTNEFNYSYQSSEAAFLIWRLSKFIRYYVKPVLTEKGLSSQDDFAILAHVDYLKTCSKKEAVGANIIDSTTGIEIIKRLIKQNLITEKENKEDKRQKLISLTAKGKDVLTSIYVGFSSIQDVLVDMSIDERNVLITTLKRLDLFHTDNIKQVK